ncbi:DnaJ homolog subfamily B member 14 [Anthophora plagiata]
MSIQQIINISKKAKIKLLQKSMLLNLKVNLTTKVKTHYETLGISPTATYNEIKTAYYELTLKYHPDKNKSESAKQIFQEISNAYDVLNKYETRKLYDRTILVKNENTTSNKVDTHRPKETFHNRDPTFRMRQIYNFDEWVQRHYTESIEDRLMRKKQELEWKHVKQNSMENYYKNIYLSYLFIVMAVLGIFSKSIIKFLTKNDE